MVVLSHGEFNHISSILKLKKGNVNNDVVVVGLLWLFWAKEGRTIGYGLERKKKILEEGWL